MQTKTFDATVYADGTVGITFKPLLNMSSEELGEMIDELIRLAFQQDMQQRSKGQ